MPMQRPKWLSGWGKGKNRLEASLIIDLEGIKVVEANFNGELALVAIGTKPEKAAAVSERKTTDNELEWKIFYDYEIFPKMVPLDKFETLMTGISVLSTGSTSVYNGTTKYIATGKSPSKGNAPLLLDYDLAKKIEEARVNSASAGSRQSQQ